MLVPIDLSAPSRCAVGLAACLGQATGAEALLLHVQQDKSSLADLAALDGLAQPIHDAGLSARLRTARGAPATRICEEVARRHVHMVVMGTRGDTTQDGGGAGPGSVARAVMRDCPVPVVAVRPPPALRDRWLWRGVVARDVPGRLAFAGPPSAMSPFAREIGVSLRRALNRSLEEVGWSGGGDAGTIPARELSATDVVILEHTGKEADEGRLDEMLGRLGSVVVTVASR